MNLSVNECEIKTDPCRDLGEIARRLYYLQYCLPRDLPYLINKGRSLLDILRNLIRPLKSSIFPVKAGYARSLSHIDLRIGS